MYYEVYVDILFAENLWMDFGLLLLSARLLRLRVRKARLVLSAFLGALGACALSVFSAYINGPGYFLATLALCAVMCIVAFPEHGKYLCVFPLLYLEAFLTGGLLRYLSQLHPLYGLWFAAGSTSTFLILYGIQRLVCRQKNLAALTCRATLVCGDRRVTAEGFYDTGNGLYDPFSGQPVSILAPDLMEKLLTGTDRELPPRMIPYRTITQSGVLRACFLDSMEIQDAEGTRTLQRPLVACMRHSRDSRALILHRDLLPP